MNPFDELQSKSEEIESKLGYGFSETKHLYSAFIHPSFANEYRDLGLSDNERLEFLGDAVFQLIISEYLFQRLEKEEEGTLSFLRSCIVCASFCAAMMKKLSLENYILLGRGEKIAYERGKETILANAFEALVGAVFLDSNYEKTKNLIFQHFKKEIDDTIEKPMRNYKAELQHVAQKYFRSQPVYEVIKEEGPGHEKQFFVEVFIANEKQGEGSGFSKKEAQQQAAKDALEKIQKHLKMEPE